MQPTIRTSRRATRSANRRGVITILTALMTIMILGMIAFAVDIGYVLSSREELQRSADAAALAACWDFAQQLADGQSADDATLLARTTADQYAGLNAVSRDSPDLALNPCNAAGGDIVFGYINDLYDGSAAFDTNATDSFNAVRVRVRRDASQNGELPLFFARIFGRTGQSLQAEATAAIVRDVRGFRASTSGECLDLLPFALDLETFEAWMDGDIGEDEWTWNATTGQVEEGCDQWLEVNLYPKGNGSPGNRGTVDIGSNNNSTNDICRQILHGVSAADLAYHGGCLKFNSCGKLYLNGDTGISAGVKDELAAIIGDPRVIPIFSEVNGPGNNAIYTIVHWCGIRIVDVKLTGPMSKKHVTIQACPIVAKGIIPATSTGSSEYVYSPAVLLK